MKRFAVVMSGCGYQDGTEITEAVSALIALSELGAEYEVFAPEMNFPAKNHMTGEAADTRSAIQEVARIARGNCKNLTELDPGKFDGLVMPGGFGAALNLSNWANQGAQCDVHPEIKRIVETFHADSKPIAAICIAPAVVARVLGKHHIAVTIGQDKETAAEIEKAGASHVACNVTDFVSDRENKIVTTPAYMYGEAKPSEVYTGIRKAIHELYEMS